MLKQYYRNNQEFSSALPREVLYVLPCNAVYQTEYLIELVCEKRNILGGCCPGGEGCGAKKRSV